MSYKKFLFKFKYAFLLLSTLSLYVQKSQEYEEKILIIKSSENIENFDIKTESFNDL